MGGVVLMRWIRKLIINYYLLTSEDKQIFLVLVIMLTICLIITAKLGDPR